MHKHLRLCIVTESVHIAVVPLKSSPRSIHADSCTRRSLSRYALFLINAQLVVCVCKPVALLVKPETVIVVASEFGTIDRTVAKYFDEDAYIHNSTTLPVVVAESMENVTKAILFSRSYPPFVESDLLDLDDALKLLATVSTPPVEFVRSKESVPSNTLSPNVELSLRSSTDTETNSVLVGGTVVDGEEVVVGVLVVVKKGVGCATDVVD